MKSLTGDGSGFRTAEGEPVYGPDEATGILVPPRDATSMAEGILYLLSDETLLEHLGENAAQDARARFSFSHQVEGFLCFYRDVVELWNTQ